MRRQGRGVLRQRDTAGPQLTAADRLREWHAQLAPPGVEVIALAGYMRLLSDDFVARFGGDEFIVLLSPFDTDEQVGILRDLITQADRLYGARHFDHYDFLIAMTDKLGGIGLEHHRSSENSVDPEFFTGWATHVGDRDLLAHEYNHSWDGKWRRPADQYVPNFNSPLQNSLLWVYEGQTEYWGDVLAARAGLHSTEEALMS